MALNYLLTDRCCASPMSPSIPSGISGHKMKCGTPKNCGLKSEYLSLTRVSQSDIYYAHTLFDQVMICTYIWICINEAA